MTSVPSCGAVPPACNTCAMICVVPFTDNAGAVTVKRMVDPDGASSGTFEQAADRSADPATTPNRVKARQERVTMKTVTILVPMKLAGQARNRTERRTNHEHGYAMAVLLVSMSIMAIMLTVAMPVWKQTVQREKEEELVFRGMQYVHAL